MPHLSSSHANSLGILDDYNHLDNYLDNVSDDISSEW